MSTTTPSPTPSSVAQNQRRRAGLEEAGNVRLLTIQDRCDRCGAQAYIRATLRTRSSNSSAVGQLFFCAHHGRKHEAALKPVAQHWLDESRFINAKPSPSANA